MKVVFVTGSRTWPDRRVVWSVLAAHLAAHRAAVDGRPMLLVHGDAIGADSYARDWAKAYPATVVEVPVPFFDWLGQRGGPMRNRAMLAIAKALRARGHEVVFEAFPMGGTGTEHMIGGARIAGFTVNVHDPLFVG